jgi:hypothetical protein
MTTTLAPPDVAESFRRDTAKHEMTVLHDDGLYRHLRFRSPENGFYWFDLVTWPGVLAINGDMAGSMFARLTDMFEFFRSGAFGSDRINPGYWAEKIRAGSHVKEYSEERFRQLVTEDAEGSAADYPGLMDAVREQILNSDDIVYEDSARGLLDEFEHGASVTARCTCGGIREGISETEATGWRVSHPATAPSGSGRHIVTTGRVEGFRFSDTWEWDLSEWSHQFLWCCHAIQWGIGQYDAHHGQARQPAAQIETVELPA